MKEQQNTHPDDKLLLFLEGRLNDEERQAVEKHLVSCETCRQELAWIENLNVALENLEMETEPCPPPLTLMMFHHGELDPETERHVKRHLIHCRKCAREVVALEQEEEIYEELRREREVGPPPPLMFPIIAIRMLRIPGNREAVRVICQRVLSQVAPREAEGAALIELLIELAARGKTITVEGSNQVAGFEGKDLMAKVVVPAVVSGLSRLLKASDRLKIEELKADLKAKKARSLPRKITDEEIRPIVDRAGSTKGKREIRQLVKVLNQAMEEYIKT